jgi:alanine dehydrogenase
MRVGVPTEVKTNEGRVALAPAGVRELTRHGHEVFVQAGAGAASGLADGAYAAQGAVVVPAAADVFDAAELIVKVKEPQGDEVELLDERHTLFAYLHLAAEPRLAAELCESGATCIAYETVEDEHGRLPLLAPMSEVAGRLAPQVGFAALCGPGGRGVLAGGVPGVAPATVLVIGGGVAGTNAARVAAGMGARVIVLDRALERLRALAAEGLQTRYASTLEIESLLVEADLVIGTVLVKGARAPRVVRRVDLERMRPGAVLVDVAIDQGGCFETSRPTSHAAPTYVVDGIVHYCVTNMPGAVPSTSTRALTNATLPYVLALADLGVDTALTRHDDLAGGVNVAAGTIVHPVVADALEAIAVAA